MKEMRTVATLAMIVLLLMSVASFADQLAWNEQDISERGAAAIRPDSLLVSYCSLADNEHVEVWLVKQVVVTATETQGLYEVRVFGRRLLRSVKSFDEGEYFDPVQYQASPPDEQSGWFLEGIDLAYVYVPAGGNSFRCLGKVLGVECEANVEIISLPDDDMAEIMKQRDAGPSSARTR